jgi:hypothetical protein
MKNKSFITLLSAALAVTTIFTSCKKDDDDPQNPNDPNESELITTVRINFTDSAGIAPNVSVVFRDLDGDGGNAPTRFDTIRLQPSTTYFTEILLLDESKLPSDTISNEVAEEANDHIFFFLHIGTDIATTYRDQDSNGLPLGLSTRWVTGTTGSGTSRVTLKHQPGVKDGTQAPGETDIELTFRSEVL